jgi:Uri superfamily endonuclease
MTVPPMLAFVSDSASAPAEPGAYALWLRLAEPLDVAAGRARARLSPGDYLYCGSARGPGGLRARLARHMRRDKRPHWHVDQLAAAGDVLGAWIEVGGDECALNAALADLPVPLRGFGSSDCRRCVAHLRFFPPSARLPSQWENARKAAMSRLSLERSGERSAPERRRNVQGREEIQS